MRGVVPLLICGLTLIVSFYGAMIVVTRWVSHSSGNPAQATIGLAMLSAPVALLITVGVGIAVFRFTGKSD